MVLQAPIFDFLFNRFRLLDDGLCHAGIGNSVSCFITTGVNPARGTNVSK